MKKLILVICCIGFANLSYAQNDVLCEALVNYSPNGRNLEITDAEWFEERSLPEGFNGPGIDLPPHCHVEGVIDPCRYRGQRRVILAGKLAWSGGACKTP